MSFVEGSDKGHIYPQEMNEWWARRAGDTPLWNRRSSMSTSNCSSLGPRDILSRDELIPAATRGNGFAVRLAVAALAGLALAVLGSLPADPSRVAPQATGITVPGSAPAPAIEFDGRGKWSGYSR